MNRHVAYLLAGALAVGLTLNAHATIAVYWGAQGSTAFDLADSTALPVGDLIEIGTFSSTNGISPDNTAGANLVNFTAFATGHIGDGVLPDGYALLFSEGQDTGFAHKQIYIVAVNASTVSAATQQGIWTVDFALAPNWRFPASTDSLNTTFIDMDDLSSNPGVVHAPLAAGAHIVIGNGKLGTGTTTDNSAGLNLTIVVPEPSTWALVVAGLLGMVGLIRRRSQTK
jgi:hypothetical protein